MTKYSVIYFNADGGMVEDEFDAETITVKEGKNVCKITFKTAFGKREYSSDRHANLDWFAHPAA